MKYEIIKKARVIPKTTFAFFINAKISLKFLFCFFFIREHYRNNDRQNQNSTDNSQ